MERNTVPLDHVFLMNLMSPHLDLQLVETKEENSTPAVYWVTPPPTLSLHPLQCGGRALCESWCMTSDQATWISCVGFMCRNIIDVIKTTETETVTLYGHFLFKIFPIPSSFPDVIFYDFSYRLRLMFHQMSQTIQPLTHAPQGLRDQQGLLAFRYVLPVFMLRIKT